MTTKKKVETTEVQSLDTPPVLPPAEPQPPAIYRGKFNPQFGFTFEELVVLIQAYGLLNTPAFTAIDAQGNFVNQDGSIVVSANLTRYFQPERINI